MLLFLGFIQLDSTQTQAFTVNAVHTLKKKKIRPPYPIVQTIVTPNQQLFFGLIFGTTYCDLFWEGIKDK